MTFTEYLKTLKDMDKDLTIVISCKEHGEFHSRNLDYFTESALKISKECSKCKVDLYMCTELGPLTVYNK